MVLQSSVKWRMSEASRCIRTLFMWLLCNYDDYVSGFHSFSMSFLLFYLLRCWCWQVSWQCWIHQEWSFLGLSRSPAVLPCRRRSELIGQHFVLHKQLSIVSSNTTDLNSWTLRFLKLSKYEKTRMKLAGTGHHGENWWKLHMLRNGIGKHCRS